MYFFQKFFDFSPFAVLHKNVEYADMEAVKSVSQTHLKYRPDIDGLRALAVLAVVAFHAFPTWMRGGFIGVDIFFVISGYLISSIIFENLEKGTFSFADFYARRVKRIFPALILVLTTCFIFGWFALFPDEFKQLGKHIAGGAAFVSNLVLWNESGYFDNVAETKPLLHLWSLGVEEQFYIIWPLVLWLAFKKRINFLIIGILVAIVSFYLSIHEVKTDAVADFYSPQTRFWELMFGSILAWITFYLPDFSENNLSNANKFLAKLIYKDASKAHGKLAANFISLFGLCILIYGFWQIDKDMGFPGKWALIPVLGTVLLIFAGPKAWVNRKILSHKIAIWFGLISFPLYLWHWPILSFGRIIYNQTPSIGFRVLAVFISIVLAAMTVLIIEKPLRFGKQRVGLKIAMLCSLVFMIGIAGFIVNKCNYSQLNIYQKFALKRKAYEHAIGSSLAWYRGKGDWLFLGNAYDNNVAKLKLAIVPTQKEIQSTKELFLKVAKTAAQYNTKVVLIVGPNKSSIYPEYLPDKVVPSSKKYSSFFLDELREVPNLVVYNPMNDLLRLKQTEGILYWMTSTHWNYKGAYLAYLGFSKLLGLPVPKVKFTNSSTYIGELLLLSKLKDFPLHMEDNWDVIWENKPVWTEKQIPDEQKSPFGSPSVVVNQNPLSDKYIWVVGDSFSVALKQYFNSTFKEVRYVGHWVDKLKVLPEYLTKADKKPDIIVIVKVERTF